MLFLRFFEELINCFATFKIISISALASFVENTVDFLSFSINFAYLKRFCAKFHEIDTVFFENCPLFS